LEETQPQEEGRKARILLVDDHPIVLLGLSHLINQQPDMTVCGEAKTAESALNAIETLKPDLMIVDISLKGTNGLDLIKRAKRLAPELPTLVLSIHDEMFYAERALRVGALGYVMKQELTKKLVVAIRRVLNKEIYLSGAMSTALLSQIIKGRSEKAPSRGEPLSDRELEIFQMIGQGQGTRQIAEKLKLSVKTVESHREHIKEKLRLKNATELLQRAFLWVQRHGPK
jgi:DNA-binding NarL/FixJ family response regulator